MNTDYLDLFFRSVNHIDAFYQNKLSYEAYKKGELKNVTEDCESEMKILNLLEIIGYQLDNIGTYLYKNMIFRIIYYLRGNKVRGEELSVPTLKEQLENPFSQFYVDIARNDLDIGIKTFHATIIMASKEAIKQEQETEVVQILGEEFDLTKYIANAFTIANYLLKREPKFSEPVLKKQKQVY